MFKIKEVKPLFTGVITTAKVYSEDLRTDAGLYVGDKMAGTLNPYQYVYAVGPMVTGVEKGNIVKINFKRYMIVKHLPGKIGEDNVQKDNMVASYEIPKINIDGVDYLFLQNNDIEYVVTDWELDNDGGLLE